MNLKETFDTLNRIHCFGFSPGSTSTKPAHVANGWFRRLLGRLYDADLLNRVVVLPTSPDAKRVFLPEAILEDAGSILEPFQPHNRRQDFTDFRWALREVVSPRGGAVNAGNGFSAYNITHAQHLTRDRLDMGMGSFLHHLVQTDLGDGPSPIVSVLREALEDTSDEISTVTLPLIHNAPEHAVTEGSYSAPSVFLKRAGKFSSPLQHNLRIGFDQLATFERKYGGGLDSLRRAVTFGVFATMIFLPNRARMLIKAAGVQPFLLYFQGRQQTTVYQSSHQSYISVRQSLDDMYTQYMMQELLDRLGDKPTAKRCEKFIREEVVFLKDQEKNVKRLLQTLAVYLPQHGPLLGLANAIRDTFARTLSATPFDVFRTVGVRIGWIRPAGNRATRKYFSLEGVLLESLLASLLGEEALTFQEFCTLLYERYGLLTGGRPQDAAILAKAGLGQPTVEDLRANANTFRRHLLDLGWARQYADGLLYVSIPEDLR